jgi:hypothetical protein
MISKEFLTDLPYLLAVTQKLTSRLVSCGFWITKYQCGDIDFSGSKFLYFTQSWIFCLSILHLLFCCRLMAPSNTTSFTLHSVLEKDNLTGTNFTNWIHNLRIVLRAHVMAIQNSWPLKGRAILGRRMVRPRIRSQCQTRHPRLVQLPRLNVFVVRKSVTGKEIASCT